MSAPGSKTPLSTDVLSSEGSVGCHCACVMTGPVFAVPRVHASRVCPPGALLAVLFRMHVFLKDLCFPSEKTTSVALPRAGATRHRPAEAKLNCVEKPTAVSPPRAGEEEIHSCVDLASKQTLFCTAMAGTRLKKRVEYD